ncbi:MAG: carbonic anhydrase [Leptospiraceae bacterium]|nr:carbonic anhydrase [Leptospiraceae bacterium]MDW7976005.1 carbonic anhydrase [Leptospiraceae bacterium]
MSSLQKLLEGNKKFLQQIQKDHPEIFHQLAESQKPEFLWIGCSDSRVPPEVITNQPPGTIFVHRNIANQISPNDMSVLSIIYFSLNYLKIKNIIVCGHTNCGGVFASLSLAENKGSYGFLENWLHPIKEYYNSIKKELLQEENVHEVNEQNQKHVADKLSEKNVLKQMEVFKKLSIVQEYLQKENTTLNVYGMIYDVRNGELRLLKEEQIKS